MVTSDQDYQRCCRRLWKEKMVVEKVDEVIPEKIKDRTRIYYTHVLDMQLCNSVEYSTVGLHYYTSTAASTDTQ